MPGPSSTPNVASYVGSSADDGIIVGALATTKVALHGAAPTVQQTAAATPIDLATSIAAITQINLILKNKGLTP